MATVTGIVDGGSVVLVHLSDGRTAPFERRFWLDFCESNADDAGTVDLRDREFDYDATTDPPTFHEL